MSEDSKLLSALSAEMLRGVSADLFEHEMFTNSKVLGRESGLNVIIGGDKAQTDGKTVILPALDKDQVVSNHAANVARGFVNHEAAHLRFSNGLTIRRFAKHEKHTAFLNGMEDARIEQQFSRKYPGSQLQFSEAANATLKRFIAQVDKGEIKVKDKAQLVPMATAWAGRRKMGQNIDPDLMKKLETMVGPEHMEVAEHLADVSLKANGTLDVARYIEKWLGKIDPETEAEKRNDSGGGGMGAGGGGSMGGDPGDDGGEGDGAGIGDDSQPDWTPGSAHGYFDPSMADAVQDALPAGRRSGGYVSAMEEDVVWDDFATFMKSVKEGGACDDGYRSMPAAGPEEASYLARQLYNRPPGEDLRKLGLQNIQSMREHLGPSVRAVKMALERGLIVAKQRNWDPGQSRGNIDPKRLATVMTGSRNFYRKRSPLEMIDTAVTLLIDMSGSMNGDKAIEAMRAAYVFAESLTKVGVPIEVLGFHSDRKPVKKPGMARAGIIDIPVFKSFLEPMNSSMWKVALSANATMCRAGGNNADGDSLLHAWRRLRLRPEPRKVLIVFSDGHPSTNGYGNEHEHLKHVVLQLTVQGCECVGIGIMSDAVKQFYDERIVIKNANELAAKAGEFLRNLLVPSSMRVKKARSDLKKVAA